MANCTYKDCTRTIHNEDIDGKCILHCMKDDWIEIVSDVVNNNNNDNLDFWIELREYIADRKVMLFDGIVFPITTKYHRPLNGLYGNDEELEKDFLFWKQGEKKDFNGLAQFTNCTFYKFDFYSIDARSLAFNNVVVKGNLGISFSDINFIIFRNSKQIKKLDIENQKETSLDISDSIIESCSFKNIAFKDINLSNSTFKEIAFNDINIEKGLFQENNFEYIKNFTNFCISKKEQFQYVSMNVKKSYSKEYFRFFKHFFNDRKDYINESDMYYQEMNTYLQEVWVNFNQKYTLDFKYLPDLIILFFGKISSNFTKCWTLPLGWIILLSCIFYCSSVEVMNISDFAKFINPFNIKDNENNNISYVWWLSHKILSSLFIYQLIVALKRKTQYAS